ncbi:MAG: hypothetical protein WC526_03300 [Patescibacteria group bacterium]
MALVKIMQTADGIAPRFVGEVLRVMSRKPGRHKAHYLIWRNGHWHNTKVRSADWWRAKNQWHKQIQEGIRTPEGERLTFGTVFVEG